MAELTRADTSGSRDDEAAQRGVLLTITHQNHRNHQQQQKQRGNKRKRVRNSSDAKEDEFLIADSVIDKDIYESGNDSIIDAGHDYDDDEADDENDISDEEDRTHINDVTFIAGDSDDEDYTEERHHGHQVDGDHHQEHKSKSTKRSRLDITEKENISIHPAPLNGDHDDGCEYSNMTIAQLKEVLRAMGLAVSGKKSELVQRIEAAKSDDTAAIQHRSDTEKAAPRLQLKGAKRKKLGAKPENVMEDLTWSSEANGDVVENVHTL